MGNKNGFSISSVTDVLTKAHLSLERIVSAALSSIMISYIMQMTINNDFYELSSYYSSINFVLFFIVAIVAFFSLCATTYYTKMSSLIPRTLFVVSVVLNFLFCISYTAKDVYFLLGLAVVDFLIIKWLIKDDKLQIAKIKLTYKACLITACVLFLLTSICFSYYTSLRYLNFQNATFDFGIFAQMFENMATTGKAVTTVERSVQMSHFGVHFSPFFYLLLPLYMIFRSPVYLICAQAVGVALGVFAVYLICKKTELSPKVTMAFLFIYSFYPCLFNGCFYDFHENKFLTTIILFLFYFILCDNSIMMFVFSLLLLSVKEDAAIYLIVIALYVIINRKRYINGGIMLAMAVIYFIIAQNIVAAHGSEGVMMWRLSDYFVNGEESFFSVFKSILFDVGYLIKMMFTADKFPFVIWMFLPLMFTPFMQDKISTLILLLPIIPINLMQTWQYQYNIDYQYTYGVAALIIFCAIVAMKHLSSNTKRLALLMSVMMCINLSASTLTTKISNNTIYQKNYSSIRDDIDKILAEIPEDKSVTAGHFIVPHLYFIQELYSVPDYYKDIEQTDYFVIDTRSQEHTDSMKAVMGNDYTLVNSANFVEIYKHK